MNFIAHNILLYVYLQTLVIQEYQIQFQKMQSSAIGLGFHTKINQLETNEHLSHRESGLIIRKKKNVS